MKLIKKMGLISLRETWTLTLKGWVFFGLVSLSCMLVIFSNIYTFLSVNAPLPQADVLVVEGWLPDYGIQGAIAEFENRGYQKVTTTGGCPLGFI